MGPSAPSAEFLKLLGGMNSAAQAAAAVPPRVRPRLSFLEDDSSKATTLETIFWAVVTTMGYIFGFVFVVTVFSLFVLLTTGALPFTFLKRLPWHTPKEKRKNEQSLIGRHLRGQEDAKHRMKMEKEVATHGSGRT